MNSQQSRRHPLFPTRLEIESNKQSLYSDHLPFLFDVPLPGENNSVKIVSWNVLGPSAPSGFHIKGDWENKPDAISRFQRIVLSLKKFISQHKLDVIVLQETYSDFMTDHLPDQPWQLIDSNSGPMMLINTDNCKLIEEGEYNPREARQQVCFTKQGARIKLYNVHSPFCALPDKKQKTYKSLLNGNDEITTILVGDTNSRIAPINRAKRNIVTGLIPMRFNKMAGIPEGVQATDFPDACFCQRQETNVIKQIDGAPLNYLTGKIFPHAYDEALQPAWDEFRVLMSLDDLDLSQDTISGETIDTYAQTLRKKGLVSEIKVYRTAKDNNERGFAFRFANDCPLLNLIKIKLPKEFGHTIKWVEDDSRNHPVVFIPLLKAEAFHNFIMDCLDLIFICDQAQQAVNSIDQLGNKAIFFKKADQRHCAMKKVKKLLTQPDSSEAEAAEQAMNIVVELQEATNQVQEHHKRSGWFGPKIWPPSRTATILNNTLNKIYNNTRVTKDDVQNQCNQSLKL